MVLNKKVGDFILEDEELLKVYVNDKDLKIEQLLNCFEIGIERKEPLPMIYEIIE